MPEVQNVSSKPMTVGDLISRLQNYHNATPVMVDGYEGGYDQIGFRLVRVKHDEKGWWYGAYDEDENGFEALVLQRV